MKKEVLNKNKKKIKASKMNLELEIVELEARLTPSKIVYEGSDTNPGGAGYKSFGVGAEC